MRPGQPVTWGRVAYTVIRPGCATGWDRCPNGEHAVTVARDGRSLTECADVRKLEPR